MQHKNFCYRTKVYESFSSSFFENEERNTNLKCLNSVHTFTINILYPKKTWENQEKRFFLSSHQNPSNKNLFLSGF